MNHLIVNHADMFSALSLIGQAAAPLLPWHFFRTLACPSASWATHPASSRGPGSVEKMGLYTVQNGDFAIESRDLRREHCCWLPRAFWLE